MPGSCCAGAADLTEKGAMLAAAQAGRFAELPIFDRAAECMPREQLRALQLEKLQRQVDLHLSQRAALPRGDG